MLTCQSCGKDVENYANKKKCRECYNSYMAEYMLKRYHRRREEAILVLGGECIECGGVEDLEIDHIDPADKGFPLGKALSGWSQTRIDKELKKCQLLCAGCHLDKTRQDLAEKFSLLAHWEHGTVGGRRYCDCVDCKKAHSDYMKEWRRRKRLASSA